MKLARKVRLIFLLSSLVCTVGCDQASKHIARTGLSHMDSITLPGGLVELKLAENPGSFLSLGAMLPESGRLALFTLGVGVGLIALLAYLISHPGVEIARFIGFSLVIAGGISNLLDRITRHGLVTDFLTIHVGPFHTGIFNLADVLIMAGFAVMIFNIRKAASSGVARPFRKS